MQQDNFIIIDIQQRTSNMSVYERTPQENMGGASQCILGCLRSQKGEGFLTMQRLLWAAFDHLRLFSWSLAQLTGYKINDVLRPMASNYMFGHNTLHNYMKYLSVGLLNVLPQLAWDLTYRFQGPNWLCKVVKILQMLPVYLSSLLLMFLAVDRYRAISWRSGASVWSSRRLARLMVVAAWAIATVLAFPQALIFARREVHPGEWDCWAYFPTFWLDETYVLFFVSSAFFIPLIVIGFSYTCITLKVWRYSRYRRGYVPLKTQLLRRFCCLEEGEFGEGSTVGGGGGGVGTTETSLGGESGGSLSTVRVSRVALTAHSHPGIPQPLSLAKVKTIKLTFVVTALFIVCHAPFCFTMIYSVFGPPAKDSKGC
ncbi:unnamed protein product, partial [Meganyctiphanes norvegica]